MVIAAGFNGVAEDMGDGTSDDASTESSALRSKASIFGRRLGRFGCDSR
jgi:hypothetical protein